MCPKCVVELPVIITKPTSTTTDDNALSNPQLPAITVDSCTTNVTNNSGLGDNTSQVNLLPNTEINIEVHVDN